MDLQKPVKTQAFLGSTPGLVSLFCFAEEEHKHSVPATASWGSRPWPDLRASTRQPARGVLQGAGGWKRGSVFGFVALLFALLVAWPVAWGGARVAALLVALLFA